MITPRLFTDANKRTQQQSSAASVRSESACNLEESSVSDAPIMRSDSGAGVFLDSSKGRQRYDRDDDELNINESSGSDRVKGAAQRSLMHLNLGSVIKK